MADDRSEVLTGVALGTRGGAMEGSVQLSSRAGIVWKRAGGGRTLEIPPNDIESLMWSAMPRIDNSSGSKTSVLVIVRKNKNGSTNLIGFPKSKLVSLQTMGLGEAKEVTLSTKGANWGNMDFTASTLVFKEGDKVSFSVPLSDVQQAQLGRDEVVLQLPVDDTAVDRTDDALAGISFYVPKDCEDFPNADSELPASKAFYDMLKTYTMDVGAGDVVASFDQVGVLVPRGRFDVEMFSSSFHLLGQAHDFRVQYSSILRIFVLPKANAPQTIVAVALDPPLRRGQTTYTMVLCQFPGDEDMTVDLQLSDESLDKLNEKGAKLSKQMTGPSSDIFAKTLRGLSGAKLTRTGAFRDARGEDHAIRCTYKNDDGYLYPLEKAFFYLMKPPMLMPYDDIRSVEFMRQSGASASKTFDLTIKMKSSSDDFKEQQYLFRSIPRNEWNNLFEWIQAKKIRVENLKEVQQGPTVRPGFGDMVGIDPALAAIDAQDSDEDGFEEEDEDFEASESESDGDDSAVEDAPEVVPERKEKKAKKLASPKPLDEPTNDGSKRKQRAKKDPNAPKKSLSAYLFFSNAKRDQVKLENPDIAGKVGDIAKKLGEMWKELSDADKEPYNKMAEQDKERYAREMANYTPPENTGEPSPKKKKVKKDPNAPKKSLSAYLFFSNAKRDQVKLENPDIAGKVGDIAKKLGEMWKELSDADKEPYNKMAEQDKERYAKEMEAYNAKQSAGSDGTVKEEVALKVEDKEEDVELVL
jgi:structure-specific recognition protein 1